jgi:16S rRNA C1402 N4-methylase RsmH
LEKIFRDYGEERQARRIARSLLERPSETTGELRRLVGESFPGTYPTYTAPIPAGRSFLACI